MIQFRDGFYADVRTEDRSRTTISYQAGILLEMKTRVERRAFLRVYDGKLWYYAAVTDLSALQKTLDGLYDAATPTLGALAPGKAVYVVIASGGDMTPEGHYATPVQMAYLVENGKLVGRLPELNISGNFFELLGKDYLGTVHGTPQLKSMLSAVTMDVNKG